MRGINGSKTDNDEFVRYIKDPHGNVVATNKDGELYGSFDYTAFGNQLEATDTTNPFRYCGEYYDEESGMVYLRNRYYNSTTGRFISEDPIKDGVNWYVYAEDNPVNMWDPNGLASIIFVADGMQDQDRVRQDIYTEKYNTPTYVVTVHDGKSFAKRWNFYLNGILSEQPIDAIEIISHGGATGDVEKVKMVQHMRQVSCILQMILTTDYLQEVVNK